MGLARQFLLLVRRSENCYPAVMNDTLIMTEEPEDLEFNQAQAKYRHNGEWLTEHGASLFEQFPGRYIAVSESDAFVADDAWEARRLAKEKHPDDEPFVQYMAKERYERIYAG
jgi:hypothetical protein